VITLKGAALEGSGGGIVRLTGSFTTLSNGTTTTVRPSKGNFTVTRVNTGVYVVKYQQAALSVVSARCELGAGAGLATGNVAFQTALFGYATISQDFMTTNANVNYAADTTNTSLLILCYNSSDNALTDVYTLSNTSSKANLRLSFDVTLATSAMNK
jgi:hypothetical protein